MRTNRGLGMDCNWTGERVVKAYLFRFAGRLFAVSRKKVPAERDSGDAASTEISGTCLHDDAGQIPR